VKVAVILENSAGELDREEFVLDAEAYADDPDQTLNDAIQPTIEGWLLSIGDTIRIVEIA
jgi:hypothetical protein